jgi:HK97 family phage prohead protease
MTTALLLTASAAGVDTTARTLSGLAVPYGPVGATSRGAVTFAAGSIRLPEQLGRVKLLVQHDRERPVGYLAAAEDTPDGMRVTFAVPSSPAGDELLAMAADGRRDGLSIGVELDATVAEELTRKWWDDDPSPTAAAGELVEVSAVTIPAFADARVDESAALAAHNPTTLTITFMPQEDDPMTAAAKARALAAAAATSPTPAATVAAETAAEVTQPAGPTPPIIAGAAAAHISSEPPVYSFTGSGSSLIRDAAAVRFSHDQEASARYSRFLAQMAAGEQAQLAALLPLLTAAVETRTTAPNYLQQGYRPDLLVQAIDKGRPLVSRLQVVGLTDATPYRVPVELDYYRGTTVTDGATTAASTTVTSATAAFTVADIGRSISGGSIPANAVITKINSATSVVISAAATATAAGVSITIRRPGISDHTEGQAHTTEGDIDVADVTITPGAVSGAFRLSRELVDASNPALDAIAIRAMARDYRYVTESKTVAALEAGIDSTIATVNTGIKVRQQLSSFYDVADEAASFLALGPGYYNTLSAETDGAGRPMLPYTQPMNALGGPTAGWTGVSVDGVEWVKSSRIATDVAYPVVSGDVHVAESRLLSFRFEEVEGPGIVKLALWAYFAAKVLRTGAVRKFSLT